MTCRCYFYFTDTEGRHSGVCVGGFFLCVFLHKCAKAQPYIICFACRRAQVQFPAFQIDQVRPLFEALVNLLSVSGDVTEFSSSVAGSFMRIASQTAQSTAELGFELTSLMFASDSLDHAGCQSTLEISDSDKQEPQSLLLSISGAIVCPWAFLAARGFYSYRKWEFFLSHLFHGVAKGFKCVATEWFISS